MSPQIVRVVAATGAVVEEPPHDFGWALQVLKLGARVRRRGWNGRGMWIMLIPASHVQLREGTPYDAALNTNGNAQSHVSIGAHVDMRTATGTMQPGWLCSQTDLLAEDWEIAT